MAEKPIIVVSASAVRIARAAVSLYITNVVGSVSSLAPIGNIQSKTRK